MWNRTLRHLLLAAFVGTFALTACVDDPGFVENPGADATPPPRDTRPSDNDADTGEEDTDEVDDPVELPTGTELRVEGATGITIGPNERGRLTVRLVRFEGDEIEPIPDVVIRFQVPSEQVELMNGSRPVRQEPRTDAEGRASIELTAGDGQAQFQVVASVRGNEDVEPITFSVRVGPKTSAEYRFIPEYLGLRMDVDQATIHLFETPNGRCSDITFDPFVQLQGDAPLEVTTSRSAFNPERFDSYVYTLDQTQGIIEPIYVAAASGIRNDNTVLFGCVDGLPEDVIGSELEVIIPMQDLFPSVAGIYNVRSDFDLPNLLPPALGNIFDIIEALVRSPGEFLVGLILDQDSTLTGVIGGIIDTVLFEVILPDSWRQGREDVTDVFDLLRQMPLSGTITIRQEADASGFLGTNNRIEFTTVDIPGLNPFSGQNPLIDGNFSGALTVRPGSGYDVVLSVEDTQLQFRIGLIFKELLENLILPAILNRPGTRVTIDALARELIDCQALAGNAPSWAQGAVRSACDGALTFLVGQIEDLLFDLNLSPAESFQLGTPPEQPCPLYDDSPSENFVIDSMGRRTPYSLRCHWQGRVQWNPNDPVQSMPGRWAGGNRRPL